MSVRNDPFVTQITFIRVKEVCSGNQQVLLTVLSSSGNAAGILGFPNRTPYSSLNPGQGVQGLSGT